ncbi:MAG TPA: hypothetical protein VHW92_04030 [Mycobacteriales bacterium]|jgi:hypothetical protein|nr:hypothetical protein [Mycobacteriales bacterium]
MAVIADGGGGGITVAPSSLTQAGSAVKSASTQVQEAGASGGLNACVSTGYPALDGALADFDGRWTSNVSRSSSAGEDLGAALSAASAAYTQTDSCVIP